MGTVALGDTGAARTGVVDAGLDDVVQREAAGGLLVAQALVEGGGQHLGHVVVVLGEVGELLLGRELQLVLVVGVAERHGGGLRDMA